MAAEVKNIIRAIGSWRGGDGLLRAASVGIASVTRTGPGIYVVTLTAPVPAASSGRFIAQLTPVLQGGAASSLGTNAWGPGDTLQVRAANSAGVATDPEVVFFVLYELPSNQ